MPTGNVVLHVADVHKTFGGLHALSDIDLHVMEGSTHAIIGPNGAGKSTLLNVCIGRIPPDTGAVVFDGDALRRTAMRPLGFSKADRDANVLRAARLAFEAADGGAIAICALISPYRATRATARVA